MHIEKIKYFIDLYDCCNYTETARKNFISQASLSQYINLLEDSFHVRLFDRSVTPIEPTNAGKVFYEESKILWKQYQNMQDKMAHVHQNQIKPLRIAYTSMVDIQTIIPYMPEFKKLYPDIELILNKVLMKDIVDYAKKKVCDLAISFASEFIGKDMATFLLYSGRYCALVSKSHPLAEYYMITPDVLYQYPLIMLSQDTIGDSYKTMQSRTIKDGFIPNIVKTVDDIESEMFYVMTDNLIGFAPDNYSIPDSSNRVKMIPITNSHHTFSIEGAYLKNNKNPALKQLLDYLKQLEL